MPISLMLKLLKSACGKFWCLSACKESTSSLTSFSRCCKDIVNLLIWELWECLTIPVKNHSINLQETFMLTCMQQINFITTFYIRYCKEIANLLFWVIWAWLSTPKMVVSRNLWRFSASKKPTSFFPFFLRYCKDSANLFFRVLWACLLTFFISLKTEWNFLSATFQP